MSFVLVISMKLNVFENGFPSPGDLQIRCLIPEKASCCWQHLLTKNPILNLRSTMRTYSESLATKICRICLDPYDTKVT